MYTGRLGTFVQAEQKPGVPQCTDCARRPLADRREAVWPITLERAGAHEEKPAFEQNCEGASRGLRGQVAILANPWR